VPTEAAAVVCPQYALGPTCLWNGISRPPEAIGQAVIDQFMHSGQRMRRHLVAMRTDDTAAEMREVRIPA
jgi:hypothetical protein